MPRHDNLDDPYFEDISTLAQILNNFGVVTGLSTNFGKSPVARIRCSDLDHGSILYDLLYTTTTFPTKYLELPLIVKRMKRRRFQYLEDKVVVCLVLWNMKHFNIAPERPFIK
jgi:hypothetical protein